MFDVRSYINKYLNINGASQEALLVKNPPVNAEEIRETGSIPGSGRSPGEGNGNPLQYSYLEEPIDRGAWRAIVHGVTKNQTWLKQLNTLMQILIYLYLFYLFRTKLDLLPNY